MISSHIAVFDILLWSLDFFFFSMDGRASNKAKGLRLNFLIMGSILIERSKTLALTRKRKSGQDLEKTAQHLLRRADA